MPRLNRWDSMTYEPFTKRTDLDGYLLRDGFGQPLGRVELTEYTAPEKAWMVTWGYRRPFTAYGETPAKAVENARREAMKRGRISAKLKRRAKRRKQASG